MPSQNEIRQTITSTIVENLKSGQLPPWRRPWALDKNAGYVFTSQTFGDRLGHGRMIPGLGCNVINQYPDPWSC